MRACALRKILAELVNSEGESSVPRGVDPKPVRYTVFTSDIQVPEIFLFQVASRCVWGSVERILGFLGLTPHGGQNRAIHVGIS